MAYKVVNKTQLDYDIKRIADALRAVSGSSSSLTFPDGMVECIRNLSWRTVSSVTPVAPDVAPGEPEYVPVGEDGLRKQIEYIAAALKNRIGNSGNNLTFPDGIIGAIEQGKECTHSNGGGIDQYNSTQHRYTCGDCGYQYYGDHNFNSDGQCTECGYQLSVAVCASCGESFETLSSYCSGCGGEICYNCEVGGGACSKHATYCANITFLNCYDKAYGYNSGGATRTYTIPHGGSITINVGSTISADVTFSSTNNYTVGTSFVENGTRYWPITISYIYNTTESFTISPS